MNEELFIGMISGTSRDGVDGVLVSFDDDRPKILANRCDAYPEDLAAKLARLINTAHRPDEQGMRSLDIELADVFARTANALLEEAKVAAQQVSAIGSHGQTVWHDPASRPPESIQLGSPERIASATGITTIGSFRQADLDVGGEGAPLAPLLHRALMTPSSGKRAIVNLGGIANISIVDADGSVSGHDTGPANCLMDGWIARHREQRFDTGGAWADSGRVNRSLLEKLLDDAYIKRPPPKSTGVEYFNLRWLDQNLAALADASTSLPPGDVQATLCEFTAITVADDIRLQGEVDDVLVCGGGVHNQSLMRRLQSSLGDVPVSSTASRSIDPDAVEATLFAWLARARLANQAQDTRQITGARQPVLLGEIFLA